MQFSYKRVPDKRPTRFVTAAFGGFVLDLKRSEAIVVHDLIAAK
jgi:hypothetical protein